MAGAGNGRASTLTHIGFVGSMIIWYFGLERYLFGRENIGPAGT
jgi:hypothetical protein